ncbi:hypothetical protein HMPREF9418_2098 [Neisseria macacae ATCC 33926]|uniref:Uncharacterized protein n=1 Tax=Neisseria macacae ATCC 33926 TaxID=997348 RepID=A0AA36UHZ3_9NEIS|nr:hypothetical protein HMPREF9418_2098 [Neisseria macacae ATCC 33926]
MADKGVIDNGYVHLAGLGLFLNGCDYTFFITKQNKGYATEAYFLRSSGLRFPNGFALPFYPAV